MLSGTDPTIEEIEAEIRKARFEAGPTEMFLSRRARRRMLDAEIAKGKNDRLRAAFLAGYRLRDEERESWLTALAIGAMLGAPLLIVLLLRMVF